MKLLKRLLSPKFLIILTFIVILLAASTSFINLQMDEGEIEAAFLKTDYQPTHHYNVLPVQLHYVTVGDSSKTPLLLIHGSPGSWDAFVPFITETNLLNHYYIIAIDRPGYGKSTTIEKQNLMHQAEAILPIVNQYFSNKGVVMGHSYGGALALKLAANHPHKFSGVVSAAGSISSQLQKPKWYNYLVKYSPLQWLLKAEFVASNNEMWNLKTDLLLLEKDAPMVSGKVALIQGGKDVLVNPKSADKFEPFLTKASVKKYQPSSMNHFIIWSDKELLINALKWVSTDFN